MRIRHIATRFAIILAIAAMLPLVAYGVWSLLTLQRGTRDSVVTGNLNVATRAAEEIRRYIVGDAEILKAALVTRGGAIVHPQFAPKPAATV